MGKKKEIFAPNSQTKAKHGRGQRNSNPDSWRASLGWANGNLGYGLVVVVLSVLCGILHSVHVSNMFERERFFSHLSTLERELSFRTEMGLYYSYYKTIVEAPTFFQGVHDIMNCNITEYPETTNTLKRFNLYPEVVLGAAYRLYIWAAEKLQYQTKICYKVNRGYNQPPVESCEGMGELSFFYVYPIFYLSGVSMSCFFLLCFYLSGSIWGGIIGTASYFFNHGEATRVMWTPPLRESFSFPLLVVQLFSVTMVLKHANPGRRHTFMIFLTTLGFMLPWQFAQFALLTQTCALFVLYILKFITAKKVRVILYGLLLGHVFNFVFQFGNSLLLSSFFMSAVICFLLTTRLEKYVENTNIVVTWIIQGSLFLFGTVGMKITTAKLLNITDDAHIVDILKSKFTSYRDFHTLLYTCAPEFSFIEIETFYKLSRTLLLPCAILAIASVVFHILRNEANYWLFKKTEKIKNSENDDHDARLFQDDSEYNVQLVENFVFIGLFGINDITIGNHFYHLLQSGAFVLMAVIIMRLKLFGTPALCLMASLLASRQFFGFVGSKNRHQAILVALLAVMSIQGFTNLKNQINTSGEYNNPNMEELITWIETRTSKTDVFAGSMPTMATVKLTTKRPIVNHPHYEDAGLRERTKKVYQIYSRKPCSECWETFNSMGINYIIMERNWCFSRSGKGCSMPEIWDVEDPESVGRESCCSVLFHQVETKSRMTPFTLAFHNDGYTVLKL